MSEIEEVIGYSAFNCDEEVYEYNEDACYIANSEASLKEFLTGASFSVRDYRIDKINLKGMLDDYGCSSKEYALEKEALERFERIAKSRGIHYKKTLYEQWDEEDALFIVTLH